MGTDYDTFAVDETGSVRDRWIEALEERHLADRTFRRSAAPSRRSRRSTWSVAAGSRGGRPWRGPASALPSPLLRPLHFLVVGHVVRAWAPPHPSRRIADLGCGTGAAGAAWALECPGPPALAESTGTPGRWRRPGGRGASSAPGRPKGDLARAPLDADGIVVAFAANELPKGPREELRGRLEERSRLGLACSWSSRSPGRPRLGGRLGRLVSRAGGGPTNGGSPRNSLLSSSGSTGGGARPPRARGADAVASRPAILTLHEPIEARGRGGHHTSRRFWKAAGRIAAVLVTAIAVGAAAGAGPTVAEAEAFVKKAEERLLELWVKSERASWVQSNFITDDTEAIAADARRTCSP